MSTETNVSPIELLLNPFVDSEAWRWGTNHQCVRGGWRIATDCRICVRVKTDEPDWVFTDEAGKPSRFPSVDNIFNPYLETFANRDLFSPVDNRTCDACNSTGRSAGMCGKCKGLGSVFCHYCEHENECGDCDGTGSVVGHCKKCDDVTLEDGMLLDIKYWYLIQSLPNVVIKHITEMSLFVFEVDGCIGQGVVLHKKPSNEY